MPPLAVRVPLVPILAEAPVVVTDIEPPAVEVPIVRAPAFVMVAEPEPPALMVRLLAAVWIGVPALPIEALPVVRLTVPEVKVKAPERTMPLLLAPLMFMVPDVPVEMLAPIVRLAAAAVTLAEIVPLPVIDKVAPNVKAVAELNVMSPEVSTMVP